MSKFHEIASLPALTPREVSVLAAKKFCRTNQEIAIMLDISVNTVKIHISNITRKWRVSFPAAMALAAEQGLLANTDLRI